LKKSSRNVLKTIFLSGIKLPNIHWILLSLGLLIRFLVMLFSGQMQTGNYWENGRIANNLIDGNGYCFNFTDSQLNFPDEK